MIEIKVKYFEGAYPIKIMEKGDWIDLRSNVSVIIKEGEYYELPLGIAVELPEGYSAIVAPRSSLFKHHHLLCVNSFGIIDSSYCGDNDEWHLLVYATKTTYIPQGERICQFRLIKKGEPISITRVNHLDNPDRGGIGSTGGWK